MQTTPAAGDAASLLTLVGYLEANRCGYCGRKQSLSYYCSADHLTAEHYQILLDRGWRRSGTALYKPNLLASCCAQYTVRLDATEFRATKDQRQSINRLNKYILGDAYTKHASRLRPLSREQAKKRDTEFDLIERIHECEGSVLDALPGLSESLAPLHKFEVTIESNEFSEEKYEVFENYQRNVHHEGPEKISKRGFTRFLCDSPIPATMSAAGKMYGSYHQCYRFDGKLVAVGVLDLLPHCVSGVYFFYHESVHQHSFGKLGALREIALAKEKGYRYWYPGFYIHNCKKMKYKGDYNPQSFLDPESFEWEPLDSAMRARLDQQKYISPSRERSGILYPPMAAYPDPVIIDQDPATDQTNPEEDVNIKEEDEEVEADSDSDSGMEADVPFLDIGMPGIMTKAELLETVDLDMIRIRFGGKNYVTSDLVGWKTGDVRALVGLKELFAGFAASIGPEVLKEAIVVLG